MTYKLNHQTTGRFVGCLLVALLLAVAVAKDIGTDNKSPSAPFPSVDPPLQRPRILYKPHGIEFAGAGFAPLPARRNMPNPNRPRPFGAPNMPMGPNHRPSKIGPRGYIKRQEGFAPPPAMRFDPRITNIPGFPARAQHNIGAYPAPGPRPYNVQGPEISAHQLAPGYQGSRDIQMQEAFGYNPFGAGAPRDGPSYPPGYYPAYEVTFAPMNPWFGLPIPTPLGPHSQLRPGRPVLVKPESPLAAPLRNLDERGSSESKEKKWVPSDTWAGAQEGKVPRPPRPEELSALVPPALRVRTRAGAGRGQGEGEGVDDVGYEDATDEPGDATDEPEDTVEEERVSTSPPPPSPSLATRGLARSTSSVVPPPLVHDDMLNDVEPLDADPSSEAEYLANLAAENKIAEFHDRKQKKNEDYRFSDTSSEQRTQRSTYFDHLLLV